MSAAFVTGGSGFVGGRLIERLRAREHEVRALARSDAAAEKVRALGAEPVAGELGDRAALRAGAEGCELAFHAAATLGDFGSREEFERGNVQGTENVLAACAEARVRRLVHVSTEAVLFAGSPLVQVDETAPLQPGSAALYSATKARAEQAVIAANGERLETVAVRPRFVWGRGDTTLLPRMVEMVKSGRFAWIGGGRHLTSTTHVENAVAGLLLAAERGRPGNVYFVTDGDPVVFRDFVGELLATQGVAAPTRNLPLPLARGLMEAGEALARVLPGSHAPPLTRFAFWVSSQECTIRIDKAVEQLGYAPVRSIPEGLAELREAHA
ncbi:MAG TPA: NAD-dependent epimerase/dehydratase family protein [Solirubrobacteraceae bacterium]|nr:NAD-dependent epimerase/dehydratase family protein [Solirubrobacteraceae bacterium]